MSVANPEKGVQGRLPFSPLRGIRVKLKVVMLSPTAAGDSQTYKSGVVWLSGGMHAPSHILKCYLEAILCAR